MSHFVAVLVTLAAVAAVAGGSLAADPVDRTCIFPRGWQYRLDPDDRGQKDAWFHSGPHGPWDDLPDDPKRRAQGPRTGGCDGVHCNDSRVGP